jgi:hypothetical protein
LVAVKPLVHIDLAVDEQLSRAPRHHAALPAEPSAREFISWRLASVLQ